MNNQSAPNDVPLEALPPISLDQYIGESGLSRTTAYRYRKTGKLKCINIAGRWYVTRTAIADFNRRAAAGEFAGSARQLRNKKQQAAACNGL